MTHSKENPLAVAEYIGLSEKHKDTIITGIMLRHEDIAIACEETETDYRIITCLLEDEGLLDLERRPGHSLEDIYDALDAIPAGRLQHTVAARYEIMYDYDARRLYSNRINRILGDIKYLASDHDAVVKGFEQRLQAIAADESTALLLVDGQGMARPARKLPDAELILSTVISYGGKTTVGSGDLSYWHDDEVWELTIEHLANRMYGGDRDIALQKIQKDSYDGKPRFGAGFLAAKNDRQVHFWTQPILENFGWHSPKGNKSMIVAADLMLIEAFRARSVQNYAELGMPGLK